MFAYAAIAPMPLSHPSHITQSLSIRVVSSMCYSTCFVIVKPLSEQALCATVGVCVCSFSAFAVLQA